MLWWEVLGVERTASTARIKQAYKKLARKYHPDRNIGRAKWAEEKFKELGEALSESHRRQSAGVRATTTWRPPTNIFQRKATPVKVCVRPTLAQLLAEETVVVEFNYHKLGRDVGRKKLSLKLHRGMRDGHTQTIRGAGNTPAGFQPGDVVLTVEVDYGDFNVRGANIHGNVSVDLLPVLNGNPVAVAMPDGSTRECIVPLAPGDPVGGQSMSFPGLGLRSADGSRGLFIATFLVTAPAVHNRSLLAASLDPSAKIDEVFDNLLDILAPGETGDYVRKVLKRKRRDGDNPGAKRSKNLSP